MQTVDQLWKEYHRQCVANCSHDTEFTKMAFFAGALLLAKEVYVNSPITVEYIRREARLHIKNCKIRADRCEKHQN